MVTLTAVFVVGFALHWAYWNIDQAYYLDHVAFYNVATGEEFLVLPDWICRWIPWRMITSDF